MATSQQPPPILPPPAFSTSISTGTPPPNTNRRILHDLTTHALIPPEQVHLLRTILISSETSRHPHLMRGGAVFTPNGPLLGVGIKPVDIDNIPRSTFIQEAKQWVERTLDTDLKARVRDSRLLEDRNTPPVNATPIPVAPVVGHRNGIKVIDLVETPPPPAPPPAPVAGPSNSNSTPTSTSNPPAALFDSPSSAQKRRLPSTFDSDLEDVGEEFKWTCNQVRRKITAFLESGEMKVTAFQKHLNVNSNSYNRFMKMSSPWQGIDNSVMSAAYRFFQQRERAGITVPKKKAKTGAGPAAEELAAITLDGEMEDAVEIYDSCDEIRRKISAHLRKDGVTQAAFLKDLAKMIHTTPGVKIQSKQLNDFRGKSGADAGNTSRVFYCAYAFFEKLRIKEGKPKSKHRVEMEKRWRGEGGMDTKHASKGVYVMKGEVPTIDQYGKIHIQGRRPRA